MFEGTLPPRVFVLHCLCANCQRPTTRRVLVPRMEGAPTTVDEFIDALEHNPSPFACGHCESLIGELVGVTMEAEHAAA